MLLITFYLLTCIQNNSLITCLCIVYIGVYILFYTTSHYVVNPLIITDPESQLALEGDTVNFTCTAIAFPAPLYNWSTPIPNTDFNTSTITILVDHSYYGNYTCFAESNGTITESQPALLTGNYIV